MLTPSQAVSASRILREHWREGSKFAALPPDLQPRNRTEGYAIQAEIESQSSAPLFGWKIAATSEAGQRHINVAGPLAGRILAETVLPDDGTASMAGNAMRVAEPEFAFRMANDLAPRTMPYDVAEELAAADQRHAGLVAGGLDAENEGSAHGTRLSPGETDAEQAPIEASGTR